ncbi:TPA: Rha family transcriptional regulator [Klebsiella quasipneumoniae subsp. quasipneumoniae]|uniref:Rha family transcriptional regulator n=1 Tax=Klebsiella quasipneumoniae TaxID=1463165 RepID=UPI00164A7977|nr:Rha family transcriptional regulator [Klebsiella quasipneumoniae]HBR2087738.1 Rha family transcriptional regulator [Klebsiella quasipneumoniae subsp. quasipneumoniae]MBC5114654.1 Rha family transcriptional regulator [Klebsiella quasipneumoniae]MCZ0711908.1 Rha family transcriptional regulator [Klebsiella quasipneumoniae]HBQ8785706.1 Rha family transcriptional regulator [Klebsiella quasipneumoniae]HBR2138624.1 Rha family transcriptional regulator [Klebsiella quasipneumoniae subsp. quasipneum
MTDLTMSIREIAELTEKEHRNVLRDVRSMFSALNLGVLNFEQTYLDVQNKEQVEYVLPKAHVFCLMGGYNVQLRMCINFF